MTLRIAEPNLWHTETLLAQVLGPVLRNDTRVAFLCDAGEGNAIISRLRVMITRRRKELQRRGKKPKRFRLHATIHRETHNGTRHDCIVVWKSINEIHVMSEELEDILGG